MGVKLFILTFFCFLMVSCHWPVSEQNLIKYISDADHKLMQKKEVKGITFTVLYKPQDLFVKQHLAAIMKPGIDTITKIRSFYKKQMYFVVSLAANKQELLTGFAGNPSDFSAMVNQLAFGMGQNVSLISSQKDTIPLIDYIYPRMYGSTQSSELLFVFENKIKPNAEWIKLNLYVQGLPTGEVSFRFYLKDIQQIPELKF